MAEYKLSGVIIALSISKDWDAARKEWDLYDIYLTDDAETCSCGHYPIKEICVLKNKLNGNQTIVGNECVKKFLGPSLYKIFQSFKGLNKDNTKALNLDAIDYCFDKKWLNEWEYEFYADTARKRNLSERQLEKRVGDCCEVKWVLLH